MSTIALAGPTSTSRPAPQLRLTRRGQAAVLTVATLLLAVLVIALGSASFASGEDGPAEPTRTVQVTAGQTLWQIAAEANPSGDIRTTVDEIVRLNSLPSASALQLGSQIAVPIY
ncbi:LysM peptidoglycan-binding domain-containing protein [Aeromicrobium sp. CF3.5]|uniref:LysM peptidoglycan-binding domain-containing protein n=1 Tax=Aeromicrobium sp. CF3.5 TaxID=3373078 RepID=UPI003EE6FD2B